MGKNAAKENLQLALGGKGKQAAQTPAPQTQARNALAPKTTNAKAKAAQTPGPLGLKQDGLQKTNQRPASLRKNKIRNDLDQSTKLQIPVDLEECPSPEIEAIHPRPADMEDIDDDLPALDLSMFDPAQGGINVDDLPSLMLRARVHGKGDDGLSYFERMAKQKAEHDAIIELREEAAFTRHMESDLLPCFHAPECEGGECRDWPEQLRRAEDKYNETMRDLLLPEERKAKEEEDSRKAKANANTVRSSSKASGNGPSDAASKRAAAVLSMRPKTPAISHAQSGSRDYAKPWLAGSKAVPPPEGYEGRHAAAVAASKTNLGFRKGRSVSAKINEVMLPTDERGRQIGYKPSKPSKSDLEVLNEMWKENEERKKLALGESESTQDAEVVDPVEEEAAKDFVLDL